MDALSKATNGFVSGDTTTTLSVGYLSAEDILEAAKQVSILGTASFGKTSIGKTAVGASGLSYKEGGRHPEGSYSNSGVQYAGFVDQRGSSYPLRSMYHSEALQVVPTISLLAARNELSVRPYKEGVQTLSQNGKFQWVMTRRDWNKIAKLLSGPPVKEAFGGITTREDPLFKDVDAHLELLEGQLEDLFPKFADLT